MVTHDPTAARSADRILRIQDGVVRTDVEPVESQAKDSVDYADILKERISEIDRQLEELDDSFRKGGVTGDEFVEGQTKLKQTRSVLVDELHRLGILY
jgi:uncharacterized protein YukE